MRPILSIFLLVVDVGTTYHYHGIPIRTTELLFSVNLFKIAGVITWAWLFLTSKVIEAVIGQKHNSECTLWHSKSRILEPRPKVLISSIVYFYLSHKICKIETTLKKMYERKYQLSYPFILAKTDHEEIRSLEIPKIQIQSPVKSESYSTRNLLPSYDNSLDNSRNDQPLQNSRVQQKLIIPKKAEDSQTTNVLILSFTRSGGAFLGQLLNNINPDTFYSIDPLPMAVLNQVRP